MSLSGGKSQFACHCFGKWNEANLINDPPSNHDGKKSIDIIYSLLLWTILYYGFMSRLVLFEFFIDVVFLLLMSFVFDEGGEWVERNIMWITSRFININFEDARGHNDLDIKEKQGIIK